jgi:hypothetical protein
MLWSFWRLSLPDTLGLWVWTEDGDMMASGRLAYVIKLAMVMTVIRQTGGIEMVSCSRLAQGRLGQSVQSYSRGFARLLSYFWNFGYSNDWALAQQLEKKSN